MTAGVTEGKKGDKAFAICQASLQPEWMNQPRFTAGSEIPKENISDHDNLRKQLAEREERVKELEEANYNMVKTLVKERDPLSSPA